MTSLVATFVTRQHLYAQHIRHMFVLLIETNVLSDLFTNTYFLCNELRQSIYSV